MTENIINLLAELVAQRQRLDVSKAAKADMLRAVEADPTYQYIVDSINDAAAKVEELTNTIKTWGEAAYIQTGDKAPAPGVKIRMVSRIDYDLPTALDWSRANLQEALTLDTKFFEAYAKGVQGTRPVPCVTFTQEPQVTISKVISVVEEQS